MKNSNFRLRQNTKESRSKKVIISAIVLFIILLASSVFAYKYFTKPETDKNADDPTITSAKDLQAEKPNNQKSDSTPSGVTAQEVPISQNLSVNISNFNQADGMVTSKAGITGSNTDGNCVFTFSSNDSRPVVEQTSSNKGSCAINISEVRFDKIGVWNLDVTFFQNNTKASATKQVTIN